MSDPVCERNRTRSRILRLRRSHERVRAYLSEKSIEKPHGLRHVSCHRPWGFFLQRHKKHPEKASHLCPMQAELGIGDGRPWAPKCGRACAIVGTRPRRGQGSGKAMLPDIHFFLLVSLKWASAAGCTLPLTHPMTHGAYGRSAPSGAALPVIS